MKFQNSSKPRFIFYILYFTFFISSCEVTKQISKSAQRSVIKDSSLLNAHVGISIYEPASGKYWYNYNGEKYFVPASNTKIPTCYAAMKYLGDSLVGLRYVKTDDTYLFPTGDPTFLHPDFENQPVFKFLSQLKHATITANYPFESDGFGRGWTWGDYNESYQSERSAFPINGNCITFSILDGKLNTFPTHNINVEESQYVVKSNGNFYLERYKDDNTFRVEPSKTKFTSQSIPFIPDETMILGILRDTLKGLQLSDYFPVIGTTVINHSTEKTINFNDSIKTIFSQPTDSLLKPMMHRSDNFFAEQSLLMVSNERLGVMNDAKIIDTLLKTDFKDLPQKPRWVDGSGLSRYNLFTPQDFVAILGKMQNEFGMNRIKEIFATGGEGTISSYYKTDSGFIYAKTGTLSGVVALSGFLTTKKNKELIFSVLVNNHNGSATAVRRAVEKFIQGIRNNY
jgi:serine-type D-Ala-D-Ala carboxypeptidase/endopeptidase (penicillin-binding protein 4)